jgi:aminodeoxychorismate lyase
MIVFLNGKFVPENRAVVSVFDRGFLYGDALFEAMIVTRWQPFRWREHMLRLRRGMKFLQLTIPYSDSQLLKYALTLIRRNKMPESILRLNITRGITTRGYPPKNAVHPAIVMSLHPAPVVTEPLRWRAIISTFRLPANDPLTGFKTTNKLPQIMARAEAGSRADEAILLNTDGRLAEGSTSNLFWIRGGTIFTPALPEGALPGVTRAAILKLCVKMKIKCRETKASPTELRRADAAFLTMTSRGVVEIASLDGRKFGRSPVTAKLWSAYRELLRVE